MGGKAPEAHTPPASHTSQMASRVPTYRPAWYLCRLALPASPCQQQQLLWLPTLCMPLTLQAPPNLSQSQRQGGVADRAREAPQV